MNFIKKTTRPAFFRILKLTSLCLSFILGLFYTYSSSEGRMYGPCRAQYFKLSGTIHSADSTHNPLKGIEVELQAYGEVTDGITDSTGIIQFMRHGRRTAGKHGFCMPMAKTATILIKTPYFLFRLIVCMIAPAGNGYATEKRPWTWRWRRNKGNRIDCTLCFFMDGCFQFSLSGET